MSAASSASAEAAPETTFEETLAADELAQGPLDATNAAYATAVRERLIATADQLVDNPQTTFRGSWVLDGVRRDVIGAGVSWGGSSTHIVVLSTSDAAVMSFLLDMAGPVAHLTAMEPQPGEHYGPQTLTDCVRSRDGESIALACEAWGHSLEVALSSLTTAELSLRERGWSAVARLAVLPDGQAWSTSILPRSVSDDGTAQLALRIVVSDANESEYGVPTRATLIEAEAGVALRDLPRLLIGDVIVSRVRRMVCSPPYSGCCQGPPPECVLGEPRTP